MTRPQFDHPKELRRQCREGTFDGPTSGQCRGYAQSNIVIVPQRDADDFALFCERNPAPCPFLERLAPGETEPRLTAPGADIRTDVPRYRVFRDGVAVGDPTDIRDLWREDLVTFVLGCSFIAEEALIKAGLLLPHIEETGFVPMYRTTRQCVPAGRFKGPLVVSMRPFTPADAARAAEITGHFPKAHGAPVHQGDPALLGIEDLAKPEYGQPVTMGEGLIPVFWGCGVTPQAAIANAKPDLAITHSPGHMFVIDTLAESTRV